MMTITIFDVGLEGETERERERLATTPLRAIAIHCEFSSQFIRH